MKKDLLAEKYNTDVNSTSRDAKKWCFITIDRRNILDSSKLDLTKKELIELFKEAGINPNQAEAIPGFPGGYGYDDEEVSFIWYKL